ncbi:carbohydrate ABC transporter permease [Leeia aquatica]|uniref:sn-glycerol-3-phosphate transport system permease protein UgpE n=1 Tax=Leeia aquatica TaxID=2725557 RepID=A0A847S5Q1_9NEIS|nr:carbohydrate ABC transporter permease [Leeia aquatica]NLR75184.1 carbohydrate ABC transporter permease [Leeia aquatica]
MQKLRPFTALLFNGGMLLLSLLWLLPLWLMLVFASHDDAALYQTPLPWLPGKELLANLAVLQERAPFFTALANSALLSSTYTVVGLLVSAMAGYAFARFRFTGQKLTFSLVMFTLTIPLSAVLIPQYLLIARDLGLANNRFGVLLPYMANALGVFFMRQIFLSLPQEVLDAARMDGAGEWQAFWRVALPMVKPGLAALGILLFLSAWTDYLWPMLVLSDDNMMTAPVAIGRLVNGFRVHWGGVMAGVLVMTLPFVLLFLFLQRQIVAGMTAGAVK